MRHFIFSALVSVTALLISACGAAKFASEGDTTQKSVGTQGGPALVDVVDDPALPIVNKPDYDCDVNGKKALVCHYPPGNPENRHTICIGKPAVDAHLRLHIAHGDPNVKDTLGACPGEEPEQAVDVEDDGSSLEE